LTINLGKYLSILFLFSGLNFPALTSVNVDENDKSNISTEYLKRLPANDYILGSGDQLRVIVSRDYPELNTSAQIDGEGTIFLPRLNRIFVAGLNISELEDILNKAFEEYVKFPSVEVIVEKYRAIRVFVEGEVQRPGLKTLQGSFSLISGENQSTSKKNFSLSQEVTSYFPTVFDAIRSSGGITSYTDLRNVQVIRKNSLSQGGGSKIATIDFAKALVFGDTSQNIRIYDSDIIKLKKSNEKNDLLLTKSILSDLNPRFVDVFITGRVIKPGKLTIPTSSVLSDAIDIAGGTKVLKGPITYIRFNNDGTIDKRKFKYRKNAKRGSYSNPMMKNGDLVFVNENLFSSTAEVITEITSPFVGIFSTYGLIQAFNN